jgi:hypothetical protein
LTSLRETLIKLTLISVVLAALALPGVFLAGFADFSGTGGGKFLVGFRREMDAVYRA